MLGAVNADTDRNYKVRVSTSPERKLRIREGRVSRENPDPVLAHRAHADAHFVSAIRMRHAGVLDLDIPFNVIGSVPIALVRS